MKYRIWGALALASLSLAAFAGLPNHAVTTPIVAAAVAANPSPAPGDSSSTLGGNPTFLYGFWTDQYGTWYKSVTDSTASTPAAVGKVLNYIPGSGWIQSASATKALPVGQYGVVIQAATAQGGTAYIQVRGVASVYCTTSGTAIAAGNALAADGAGNLTYNAGTTAGAAWGIAIGTLASSTSTPTLTSVFIGGY